MDRQQSICSGSRYPSTPASERRITIVGNPECAWRVRCFSWEYALVCRNCGKESEGTHTVRAQDSRPLCIMGEHPVCPGFKGWDEVDPTREAAGNRQRREKSNLENVAADPDSEARNAQPGQSELWSSTLHRSRPIRDPRKRTSSCSFCIRSVGRYARCLTRTGWTGLQAARGAAHL